MEFVVVVNDYIIKGCYGLLYMVSSILALHACVKPIPWTNSEISSSQKLLYESFRMTNKVKNEKGRHVYHGIIIQYLFNLPITILFIKFMVFKLFLLVCLVFMDSIHTYSIAYIHFCKHKLSLRLLIRTKYSRIDQVKFVEDSL